MRGRPARRRVKRRQPGRNRRARPDPVFIAPSLATLGARAPDTAGWVHEIKFDGYRIQARLDDGKVTLKTRTGLDWTANFRAAKPHARLYGHDAMIDGELVVDESNGISDFSALQDDLKNGRDDRMALYVFDLLHLDGADLDPLPLATRKAALSALSARPITVRIYASAGRRTSRGPVLFKHACRMGLEGIIEKLADARIIPGAGTTGSRPSAPTGRNPWVRGLRPSSADVHAVGALVLAVGDPRQPERCWPVGTGFSDDTSPHALTARSIP